MNDLEAARFFLQLSTAIGAVVLCLAPGFLLFVALRWAVERLRGKGRRDGEGA